MTSWENNIYSYSILKPKKLVTYSIKYNKRVYKNLISLNINTLYMTNKEKSSKKYYDLNILKIFLNYKKSFKNL